MMLKILKVVSLSLVLGMLAGLSSGNASAQLIEDVDLRIKDSQAIVNIKFSLPVHYLRHFPVSKGGDLQIYFDIVSSGSDVEVRSVDETRKSPPSKLVPAFTMVVHDLNTQPRLSIQFDRVVEYEVRAGAGNRSFILTMPVNAAEGAGEPLPDLPEVPEVLPDGAAAPDNNVPEAPPAGVPADSPTSK
ncbi:MAG: hypothetical protein ACOY4U_07065 [Pseudomonadota bacterium]